MNPNDEGIELRDALAPSFANPVGFDEKSILFTLWLRKPVIYYPRYNIVSISLDYFIYTVKSTHGVEEHYNDLRSGERQKAIESFMNLCRFIKSKDI